MLNDNKLFNFKRVNISQKPHDPNHDSRYIFDDTLSSWLNYGCKKGFIGNVSATENSITFDISVNEASNVEGLLKNTGLVIAWI